MVALLWILGLSTRFVPSSDFLYSLSSLLSVSIYSIEITVCLLPIQKPGTTVGLSSFNRSLIMQDCCLFLTLVFSRFFGPSFFISMNCTFLSYFLFFSSSWKAWSCFDSSVFYFLDSIFYENLTFLNVYYRFAKAQHY